MVPARTLLYVSPVVPAEGGNGLAMQSCTMLGLLARRHAVSLLVVPLHGPVDAEPAASVRALCRDVEVRAPAPGGASPFLAALRMQWPADDSPGDAGTATAPFIDRVFDVVHVYRLTALPYALPYLFGPRPTPARHLDLDEAESATRRRLARLCRTNGDETAARFAELEARSCARLERDILERFDRVYLSSSAEHLPASSPRDRATVSVVPNVVGVPASGATTTESHPFRILFVGTLAFSANEDAVTHFCRDILPCLRRVAPRSFEFVVVGRGASPRLHAVVEGSGPAVRLVGAVEESARAGTKGPTWSRSLCAPEAGHG